jgi:hypothetical protein
LAACAPDRSEPIGGQFTARWSSGPRIPDHHPPHALYYGEERIAAGFLDYSLSPDGKAILYDRNEIERSGLYLFSSRWHVHTKVGGWMTVPSDSPQWSPDSAYVVLNSDPRSLTMIDVRAGRVLDPAPVRLRASKVRASSWESPRTFSVSVDYEATETKGPAHERITITVAPFEIRGENGKPWRLVE